MSTQPTEHEQKFKGITWYARRGWPIFPCGPDKKPLTQHGFKDATTDLQKLEAFHNKFPSANWGMPTGATTELVVIDIDAKTPKHSADGFATWDQLREENSDLIQTVTVKTGGGGSQLYFKYPKGHSVKSGTNVLGPGVDIRADGGYVIVPGISKTDAPYIFELSPADTEIQELPAWALDRLNGSKSAADNQKDKKKNKKEVYENYKNIVEAGHAIIRLKPERADNYEDWLHVGMSLYELGQGGLNLWEQFSKQSPKYAPGVCAQKWATFNKSQTDAHNITLASLFFWAGEDGKPLKREAPEFPTPTDYANFLKAAGWAFTLNEMNDGVYCNGERMNDILEHVFYFETVSWGYKSKSMMKAALFKTAFDNKFHPIKDYLNGLVLDKSQDHIEKLCSFFKDKDDIFKTILTKWLVGAVGRIIGDRPGQQHPMIVLDGKQGIGKSRFAWWLGSPLPDFYIQSSINPDNKDHILEMCSKFVFEVDELGSTIRKSDLESLKAYLSKEIVSARAPYGHFDIVKPATASYIGTINNAGGFLADPTGSRRFRVCTLLSIDWDYEKHIDINQVWAQAVELYRAGERWMLEDDQNKKMLEINSRYEVDDPIYYDLINIFHIDPAEKTKFIATAQIVEKLRNLGKINSETNQQVSMRIAGVLVKMGCDRDTTRVNGHLLRGWAGIWPI